MRLYEEYAADGSILVIMDLALPDGMWGTLAYDKSGDVVRKRAACVRQLARLWDKYTSTHTVVLNVGKALK